MGTGFDVPDDLCASGKADLGQKIRQPVSRHEIAVLVRVERFGFEAGHDAVVGGQARPLLHRRSHMPIVIAGSSGCAYPVDLCPPAAIGVVWNPESIASAWCGHQSASGSCWSMRISECFTIKSTTFSKV
jgi:hypothetical protein